MEELNRVACLPSTDETDTLMLGYALEGIRLAGTFGSYREVAAEDVIVEDDGREVPVKPGDRVFVSFVCPPSTLFCSPSPVSGPPEPGAVVHPSQLANTAQVSAALDPAVYPSPKTVNPRRDRSTYIFYGLGPHACLGRDASEVALTELFRAVFRRRNVRRVPGPQGCLKKVGRPGGFFVYMGEDWGGFSPFPASMRIMWDD